MNISSVRSSSSYFTSQLMRRQATQEGGKTDQSQQTKKFQPVAKGDSDNDGDNSTSVRSATDTAQTISVAKSRESSQNTSTYNSQARINSSNNSESAQNTNANSPRVQPSSSNNAGSAQGTNAYNSQPQAEPGGIGSRIDIVV